MSWDRSSWQPPSPEMREQALALLRSRGGRAIVRAQKLLGWHSTFGMPRQLMAKALDLTEGQLRYLLDGQSQNARAKRRRSARAAAKTIRFARYTSQRLRFSILLPEAWVVATDTNKPYPLANEWLDTLRRGAAIEEAVEVAERQARLEKMQTGLFQAAPADRANAVETEISRLRLDEPLTAFELYQLDKLPVTNVPWGNRPRNGIMVDGLHGVLYYYLFDTGEALAEQPIFFNVYLAHEMEGWIISSTCRVGGSYRAFERYKPVFRRIVESFRRIRAL